MALNKKQLRYYYWIAKEFTKKNARLILLSFLSSIVVIVTITSLSPYVLNIATNKKQIIGMVGTYDVNNLPEDIQSKISYGLVAVSPQGKVTPVLADKWEESKDGKEYKFYLKPNVLWNNGDRFTAEDISYKFKDVTITPLGDTVIDFKLQKPLPIFPTYLTQPILKYPLVGVAGLYKVDRIKTQFGNLTQLDLAPNRPNLPIIIYKFYDSETKMVNAYKLGEIREMTVTKKSIADSFTNWRNTAVSKTVDYTRLLTLFFNLNNQYLKDKDFRQAVAMAISRDNLAEFGEEAVGSIPPTSWAYSPNIKQTPYDPDLADKLLKKSATASAPASLTLSTYEDYLDISDKLQTDLNRDSLKTNVDIVSFDKPNSFDMLLAYLKIPPDPDQYFLFHSTQTQGNIMGYKNVKVDKLLEDGRNTLSVTDRKKLYADFEKVIADELPAIFLYYPYTYTIKRK